MPHEGTHKEFPKTIHLSTYVKRS